MADEVQRQIEVGVGGVVAQRRMKLDGRLVLATVAKVPLTLAAVRMVYCFPT